MYKKLFATFLACMFIGLSNICPVSLGHAIADQIHTGHEDQSAVGCVDCEPGSATSMTCCFDSGEKPVSLTVDKQLVSESYEVVSIPSHLAIAQLDSAEAKERRYLTLSYDPRLIRIGIVVKKE